MSGPSDRIVPSPPRLDRLTDGDVPFRRGHFLAYAPRDFHRIAYVEWGDAASPHVAICVHGLSRQGRDFDALAYALARIGYRVICPDLPGRGLSGWLRDPELYALPQYASDMAALIAHLGVTGTIDWIGTSLGGLTGMVLAAAQGTPIRRLVINDIGPFLPWAPIRQIGNRLRDAPRLHHNLASGESRLRTVLGDFGPLTDEQWRHIAVHSFVQEPTGGWRPHYDPAIGDAFRPGRVYSVSMWRDWDAIRCPVLLLRGARSDLLLPETADEMMRRGPRTYRVEIPDCGHAPALLDPEQIRVVTDWMGSPQQVERPPAGP
ncbi:alpha/beta fold hydrolase [Methylobacterium aerolatum]|uniref:Pimeloyl-ACP methyl ester carboxylesterase n=1 Tax=Methylobacterium aerolatum TaxID=418708 RepID=A0ABU0HYC5_9HYPH|nr:alpha/beta hydrolase [Methylobacterium aerolatum]MDQ0447348.1 pimeloyl-ACP methyl ester carboxylesterase [Methylobacterium aerolatum]GJD34099.1 2-succinyl-6-hydroxy-2, 4-cyclohexadiene-1-carboxylate synthase [Methylobacterium aerolatum]